MKKFLVFLLSLLILCAVLVGGVYFYVKNQLKPASFTENQEPVRLEVTSGETVTNVALKLKKMDLIKNEKLFCIFASRRQYLKYFFPSASENETSSFVLKSGIYYVTPGMNVPEIYELLSSGRQEYVSVSIPEGYTMRQISYLLEEKGICSSESFIAVCKDPVFLENNRIPLENAEGYLFPDTYFFIPDSDPQVIAQNLVDTFYTKIAPLFEGQELTPEKLSETVILASIVEREYKVKKEAPLIASVFKNRIRIGMGLQSCATVMYILEDIQGKPHQTGLSEEDTKIDNLYNTYKWAGLTPGPISNPGLTALDAVVNTPKTSYYFFFVNYEKNDGTHVFSKTFDEHVENRRRIE